MTQGVITSLSDADKDPGFYGDTVYAAGAVSVGDLPLKLLLVGLKHTDLGSIVVDTDVVQVFSADQGDTLAGAGSELARMIYAALQVPGVQLFVAAPSPAGSATAASATITIGSSWTVGGEWRYWIAGEYISGGITATDTPTTVAAAITAAIQKKPRLAVKATSALGVVTMVWKSAGIRGNDGIVFQDKSGLPSGCTSVLAGGAAVTGDGVSGNGVRFTGGAGTEDVSTLLDTLKPGRYHRIAAAQRDASNLAKWETQLDTKAGPTEGRMEHIVFGTSASLSAATSLAQITLNNWRCQVAWHLDSETPPPEVAAVLAATRTSTEQTTPNVSYSGRVLPGVAPQRDRTKWLNRSTRTSALDNGVTPINSNDQGKAVVVRSITTRSLTDSGDPDSATLDTSDAVVPDYARDSIKLRWAQFVQANPHVRGDLKPGEKSIPEGVATPKLWAAEITSVLLDLQAQKILTQVELNPPKVSFNATAKRLAAIAPVVRLPLQEQAEVSVRAQRIAA